jgi:hypothetical protein
MNLFALFGRLLSMMDAVLATIFDGLRAICRKHEYLSSFILNQAKAFLPNPFRRGFPRPIGCIQRYHAVEGANGTTMVVMFVG